MRLVFPILTLNFGGAQRMLAEITNGLSDQGYDVTIVMPAHAEVKFDIRSKIVRGRHSITLDADDIPPGDIVISNFYTTVPACVEASKRDRNVHARFSLCYEPTFLPDDHITFPTYHCTPHVIVLSGWQQKLIELNHGIRGHIVPIGIDPFMHNLNLRHSTPPAVKISAVVRNSEGGIAWHRDQDYLVSQLAFVKHYYPDTEINLICPPDEFHAAPTLQRLRDTGSFQFCLPNKDEELRYLYNKTDIYVSSSLYDSGSLPGLEAMRCGAALVTTYSGGNLDYARHEHNCLLSYRYQNRLAADIIRLIHDKELRSRLALQGESDSYQWPWARSVEAFAQALHTIWNSR
ncbi:glycosyltransferase family 4 protein [Paenibacillus sp. FJAT-26967]|uniref:glycosyltransferase family 4 protein n=1 Tax=Paenibacillus sp. FJAT-26967 TaxID=1729690 RepID=UPI0008392778|nr:glycosyltransferase family 4 protein [Paenibacillus sp. FJAT-26967]